MFMSAQLEDRLSVLIVLKSHLCKSKSHVKVPWGYLFTRLMFLNVVILLFLCQLCHRSRCLPLKICGVRIT